MSFRDDLQACMIQQIAAFQEGTSEKFRKFEVSTNDCLGKLERAPSARMSVLFAAFVLPPLGPGVMLLPTMWWFLDVAFVRIQLVLSVQALTQRVL